MHELVHHLLGTSDDSIAFQWLAFEERAMLAGHDRNHAAQTSSVILMLPAHEWRANSRIS